MPPPWPAFAFPTGDSAAGDNVGKQALCHGDHWSPDHVAVPNFSRSQRRWNSSGGRLVAATRSIERKTGLEVALARAGIGRCDATLGR